MSIKYNLKKTSKPLVRHLQLKKRACPVCSSKKTEEERKPQAENREKFVQQHVNET